MQLQLVVSSTAVARQLVAALEALGHRASTYADVPGLVHVTVAEEADVASVHRVAARLDHPAGYRSVVPRAV